MARCEPNEKNDHLRNRQFEGQVQDQVPARHVHVHVVLWDESPESPDDAAEERDENIGEYPRPGGEGK